MAAKQFTAEQLKSPYILYVEIVADLPRWGIKAAPFIELKSIPYGRYEVRRPLPLKETGKILAELELFTPPYTTQYTPAEAAEFINLVVANHPKLHAKTTYHDYNKHLVWMREHKAPAAKKPAAKRAPAKVVAGKVQFKIGRTYFQRWYSDWDNSHSDVYMIVVGRTPTMIEAESNTFGNTPSKIVRKKFKIHVDNDGIEFIMPEHYAGAKTWKASNIVKTQAAVKTSGNNSASKSVGGLTQFKVGKSYYLKFDDGVDIVKSKQTLKVIRRTPKLIEVESTHYDISDNPGRLEKKRFIIHIDKEMNTEYINSGENLWYANHVVGGR